MTPDLSILSAQKEALRKAMRAKRLAHEGDNSASSAALMRLFLSHIKLQTVSVIAGYQAFRGEIDVNPLMDQLRQLGHTIVLPIVGEKGTPLSFRLYDKEVPLVANKMGILEPDISAPTFDPDVLLVPLLAFDKNHNRLGYGAGFYDRTLAFLRAQKPITAVGIAHSYQEVEKVPVHLHDQRLDKVITPVNVF